MKLPISKDHLKLVENIFSMVSLRALEYILSFLIVPYLLFTLGPERTGLIAFMQGWLSYASLITNYGFGYTAPRAIAQSDSSRYTQLFSLYFWGSTWLGIACSIAIAIIVAVLYSLGVVIDIPLLLVLYTGVVGGVIFPIWFYQGIQEMRYITILNLAGRLICMVSIFIFVHKPEDYIWAALFQAVPTCISGIISLFMLNRKYDGLFVLPKWADVMQIYKDGWQIFASSFIINIYTSTTIVILGLLTNQTVVGYYTAADKLIGCVRRFISAVNNAVYPYIISTIKSDVSKGMRFLYKQLAGYFVFGIMVAIVFICFSDWIVITLLGTKYASSVQLFEVLAWLPLLIACSNVLGGEMMLAFKMDSLFSKTLILGAVVNTALIFPLTHFYGAVGTAWTQVITEGLITLAMAIILYKKGFFKSNSQSYI